MSARGGRGIWTGSLLHSHVLGIPIIKETRIPGCVFALVCGPRKPDGKEQRQQKQPGKHPVLTNEDL